MDDNNDIVRSVRNYVTEAFKYDGWLQSYGFKHLQEQYNYAESVVNFLFSPQEKPLSILEADTGTGKTIGYLIPLLTYAAITNKRIVISTYTIRLQNQILAKDYEVAKNFLRDMGLPSISIAQRIGRSHYVDSNRVQLYLNLLKKKSKLTKKHSDFLTWAKNQEYAGSGLLQDWLDVNNDFPSDIDISDVCLTPESSAEINFGFINQILNARHAQIVITSHACVFENLRQRGALFSESNSQPISTIIFDEAHNLPNAATNFGNKRLQLRQVVNIINIIRVAEERVENYSKTRESILLACSAIERLLQALDNNQKQLKITIELNQIHASYSNKIKNKTNYLGQKCKEYIFFFSENKESLSKQVRTAILELEYLAKWLIEFGNSQHGTYEGIGFSEKLRIPSLVSTDYLPGRKIRQYLTGNKLPKCKILLTSATISDTNSNIGEDSFTDIRVELGIKQNEIYQRKKFFPSDFGSMSFVLPDKNIPNPVLKNETGNIDKVSFDPQWLKYISSMILEAGKNRRGVLVLTHSFSETEAIRSQIIETKNIYFHLHDTQIKDCIDALKEQSGILISPGLSEGFSERKPEGAQLFGDLVITRIPFNPFSEFHQDVFVEQYLKNVIGSNMNMAKRSFYAKSQGYALRKFRQQLGRGLRKYDDSITIWVGDPRFPHPSAINNYSLNEYNSIFRRVIPTRFYNEYQNSLVFGEDGRFNKAILEENMENIVL